MQSTEDMIQKLRLLFDDVIYINDQLCFCKSGNYWGKYSIRQRSLDRVLKFDTIQVDTATGIVAATGLLETLIYNKGGEVTNRLNNKLKVKGVINGVIHVEASYRLQGIVSPCGGYITPLIYTDVRFYHDSKFIVLVDNENEKLADYKGMVLTSKLYDNIIPLTTGNCIGHIGDKTYLIKMGERMSEEEIKVTINSKIICKQIN